MASKPVRNIKQPGRLDRTADPRPRLPSSNLPAHDTAMSAIKGLQDDLALEANELNSMQKGIWNVSNDSPPNSFLQRLSLALNASPLRELKSQT